ncbi:hypothetical protein [Oleiagrimonas sp. MCCC 1A03011]|uniref:hypothetical protein n=1 Tax=Oleiagrimonas sp. MCCC 1A03011 TaxID=1926883 RepID=UPI0011BE2770|nr:hypothetical protein [Oleiagrimonas sp. MCCC 1A03011]
MEVTRLQPDHQQAFSLRRATIMAWIVFGHGMLGLLLLAPASPRRFVPRLRARAHSTPRGLIAVFLKSNERHAELPLKSPHSPQTKAVNKRGSVQPPHPPSRRLKTPRIRTTGPIHPIASPHRLELGLPSPHHRNAHSSPAPVPRYIAGGQVFQQRLRRARLEAERGVPHDDDIPGMPHFAMRDPRKRGIAGVLHFITHSVLDAADPACVQAGADVTMSKAQRERVVFEHHCILRPHSWLAPDGPATHLTGRPPGHGMP